MTRERACLFLANDAAAGVAQHVLHQDLDRHRRLAPGRPGRCGRAGNRCSVRSPDAQRGARRKGIRNVEWSASSGVRPPRPRRFGGAERHLTGVPAAGRDLYDAQYTPRRADSRTTTDGRQSDHMHDHGSGPHSHGHELRMSMPRTMSTTTATTASRGSLSSARAVSGTALAVAFSAGRLAGRRGRQSGRCATRTRFHGTGCLARALSKSRRPSSTRPTSSS